MDVGLWKCHIDSVGHVMRGIGPKRLESTGHKVDTHLLLRKKLASETHPQAQKDIGNILSIHERNSLKSKFCTKTYLDL